jgi:hypothetical protein
MASIYNLGLSAMRPISYRLLLMNNLQRFQLSACHAGHKRRLPFNILSTILLPSKAPLPFLGTWKLTKCEPTRPDLPHPLTGTAKATQGDDGVHLDTEGTFSDGRAVKTSTVVQLDGMWYPVTGNPLYDSVSGRRLDQFSIEARYRKGGADVGKQITTVSADGKTLTAQVELSGPGGVAIAWKSTSERQ